MGTKQSVSGVIQQSFLPTYNDHVMSDGRKVKPVGLFGFCGPNVKSRGHDSDQTHDSVKSKADEKSAQLQSTDLRKKKFSFRAPVRSASAVCSGTLERPDVKANNGTSLLSSKGKPFRPPGMESWKMIDDDNASGRSRSSSREKSLKAESSKKTNVLVTNSLPVNLNSSRSSGRLNHVTHSHAIDAQASANDDSIESQVPGAGGEGEVGALVPEQNSAVTKSVPSFLRRPKGFLFSGLNQRKSGIQRHKTSTPEKTGDVSVVNRLEMHSNIQASPVVDRMMGMVEHIGESKLEGSETKSRPEKTGNSNELQRSSVSELKRAETASKADNSRAKFHESRNSSRSEEKTDLVILSSGETGQGSSLDMSGVMAVEPHPIQSHTQFRATPSSEPHPIQSRQTSISDAPLASVDFDDECSICSDDLMLDVDVNFDAEESTLYGSHRSSVSEAVKRRLSNPRLSSAIPYSSDCAFGSDQKVERRSSLVRRQRSNAERGTSQKSDRRLQSRLSTASIDSKFLENIDKCVLSELMSLMEVSNAQQKSENASCDGKTSHGSGDVTSGGQSRRQLSLKPPRQSSLIDDDELVVMDGFVYRSMIQELTSTKTMLFKLKRMLQEDELGYPPFNHSVFKSNSDQTFVLQSDDLKMQNPDSEPSLTQLLEKNSELQSVVRLMQHTIEDQKKMISLFQQQMTKYECGMTDITEDD